FAVAGVSSKETRSEYNGPDADNAESDGWAWGRLPLLGRVRKLSPAACIVITKHGLPLYETDALG
ncbi:hypothetical protein AB9F39_37620, partial [Rhizobium leguminosarum]|uniref:hypothetical protein n=1 Tax=Rhizobium leguminosarum TaxID=384 RepID=UPI003F9742D8